MAKPNHLLACVLALSSGASAYAVIAKASTAYDRRIALTTAPTRQLIAGDFRRPGTPAQYSAEVARAPLNPALFNRWISAAPSEPDQLRGFALLRSMGFRDVGAQLNIITDSLLSSDIDGAVERIDGLLAQQIGRPQAIETLSRMERVPQFSSALVKRLDLRPSWRGYYLFNAALLANPVARRARLRTLSALQPGADTLAAYAFASWESWKRADFVMSYALWQRGAGQRDKLGLPIGRPSFPFDWRAMTSANFETMLVPDGDHTVVSILWNGGGAAPFLVRNLLGPVDADAPLARMLIPAANNGQIMVLYRCQGAKWIIARLVTGGRETIFRASRKLTCIGAEVAIVPASRWGGSAKILFDLSAGNGLVSS